jgi:uncharacterized protein (TIGR02996 family)
MLRTMSRTRESLLAAVVAAPTELAPRHAYAEAVREGDPERAELIDLQLAIRTARRAGRPPAAQQVRRARMLAHARGTEWAGAVSSLVQAVRYRGGFVEEVQLTPAQLEASAQALFGKAPVRHLAMRELHGHVAQFAQTPQLARLVSLDVNSCQLTDSDVATLVASPHLRGLRFLRVNNNPVGMEALRAIARAHLPALQYVDAESTSVPLVTRAEDAAHDSADASFTRVQAALVEEFPDRPWLKTLNAPHLDVL